MPLNFATMILIKTFDLELAVVLICRLGRGNTKECRCHSYP